MMNGNIPAVAQPLGLVAGEARANRNAHAGLQVEAHAVDLLRARVDRVRVGIIGARLEPVAPARIHPVADANSRAVDAARGNALRSVILRAARKCY